ncbi:Phosphate-regulating neutral endopeptidase, partial [Stegodyphus mimosarum]
MGPNTSFNHVNIREELSTNIVKGNHHMELLRYMAFEIINDIPAQALVIYTDGSRSDKGRAGSGIYCNTPEGDIRCSIRNSDHCSVFRSELIAIRKALDYALCSSIGITWILTGSRSSIQYLKNWPKIVDKTGQDIVSKLFELVQRKSLYLQWIPSLVGVYSNKTANDLARKVLLCNYMRNTKLEAKKKKRELCHFNIVFNSDDNVTGRKYFKNGKRFDWWSDDSRKAFQTKTQCIIDQYNTYLNYRDPKNSADVMVDGNKTQVENLADSAGLKLAYLAYQTWVKLHGSELKLPGLKYNQNQLFWISAGRALCEEVNLDYIMKGGSNGEYFLPEARLNGQISNLEEFAKDFNCASDQFMNRKNKCQIW